MANWPPRLPINLPPSGGRSGKTFHRCPRTAGDSAKWGMHPPTQCTGAFRALLSDAHLGGKANGDTGGVGCLRIAANVREAVFPVSVTACGQTSSVVPWANCACVFQQRFPMPSERVPNQQNQAASCAGRPRRGIQADLFLWPIGLPGFPLFPIFHHLAVDRAKPFTAARARLEILQSGECTPVHDA